MVITKASFFEVFICGLYRKVQPPCRTVVLYRYTRGRAATEQNSTGTKGGGHLPRITVTGLYSYTRGRAAAEQNSTELCRFMRLGCTGIRG